MPSVADVLTTGIPIPSAQVDARAYVAKFGETLDSGDEVPLSNNDIAPKHSSNLSQIATHNGGVIPVYGSNQYDWGVGSVAPSSNAKIADMVAACYHSTNASNQKMGKCNAHLGEGSRYAGLIVFNTANKVSGTDGAETWSFNLPIWGNALAFTAAT